MRWSRGSVASWTPGWGERKGRWGQWEGRGGEGGLLRRLTPLCGAHRTPGPYPDPLEPKREVCELNPDCDELADHIGFQEAYARFYGTA